MRAATIRVQSTGGQSGATELDADTSLDAAGDLNALLADHTAVCVDLRSLARTMGGDIQQEMERNIFHAPHVS